MHNFISCTWRGDNVKICENNNPVLILNCISNQEANYYALKVGHQASNVPEQDGLECAFPRLPGHLPGPQHPDGGGAETGVRVPFPLLLPGGAAECS